MFFKLKYFYYTLVIFCLGFYGNVAYALPLGNPMEASLFLNSAWLDDGPCDKCYCDRTLCWFDSTSLRIGFYGDYIWDRHLKVHGRKDSIDTATLFTNALYLAWNVCDLIDIFGSLGTSTWNITTNGRSFTVLDFSGKSELGFENTFSWSIGARTTLLEWCCTTFGIEIQYFQTRAHFNHVRNDGGSRQYFSHAKTHFEEVQIGLGLAYRITSYDNISFIPYIGAKWSWAHLDFDHFSFIAEEIGNLFLLPKLQLQKHWGYAVGLTMVLSDMIAVTAEGRWADERAIYVNGQFRF